MTLFFAVCKMSQVATQNGLAPKTEHWYLVDREKDLWSDQCHHATSFSWRIAAEVVAACGPGAYLTDQNGGVHAVDRGRITASANMAIMFAGEMKDVTPKRST